jgi:hypothetical protein
MIRSRVHGQLHGHIISFNSSVPRVRRRCAPQALTAEQVGLGFLLLAPGTAALIYSAIRGKGNISDGFSHLVTIVSQGYLQPDAGGKHIPVATGDLSEFGESYITFLYSQYATYCSSHAQLPLCVCVCGGGGHRSRGAMSSRVCTRPGQGLRSAEL